MHAYEINVFFSKCAPNIFGQMLHSIESKINNYKKDFDIWRQTQLSKT